MILLIQGQAKRAYMSRLLEIRMEIPNTLVNAIESTQVSFPLMSVI